MAAAAEEGLSKKKKKKKNKDKDKARAEAPRSPPPSLSLCVLHVHHRLRMTYSIRSFGRPGSRHVPHSPAHHAERLREGEDVDHVLAGDALVRRLTGRVRNMSGTWPRAAPPSLATNRLARVLEVLVGVCPPPAGHVPDMTRT